jgi:hypothetical protein
MTLRCWCHAAMAGWLGEPVPGETPPADVLRRWQAECERAGADCPARVEAIALRLPSARARRQGRRLTLFTEAGPQHFQDPAQCFVPQHRYLGPVHRGQRHLVWRRGHAKPFVLVDIGSGAQNAFVALDEALAFEA